MRLSTLNHRIGSSIPWRNTSCCTRIQRPCHHSFHTTRVVQVALATHAHALPRISYIDPHTRPQPREHKTRTSRAHDNNLNDHDEEMMDNDIDVNDENVVDVSDRSQAKKRGRVVLYDISASEANGRLDRPSRSIPISIKPTSSTASSAASSSSSSSSSPTSPTHSFNHLSNFPLSSNTIHTLQCRFKIDTFYPVQVEVLTPALHGKDILARSHTGSGKTLAFLIPIVEMLRKRTDHHVDQRSCTVLIMEPTRELVHQVADELRKLCDDAYHISEIYGGVSYTKQEQQLATGVDVVVATPGRLIDHMSRHNISLKAVQICVLDEADEMLRLGFIEDVELILNEMPQRKQTMMFSDTMPKWMDTITRRHLHQSTLR